MVTWQPVLLRYNVEVTSRRIQPQCFLIWHSGNHIEGNCWVESPLASCESFRTKTAFASFAVFVRTLSWYWEISCSLPQHRSLKSTVVQFSAGVISRRGNCPVSGTHLGKLWSSRQERRSLVAVFPSSARNASLPFWSLWTGSPAQVLKIQNTKRVENRYFLYKGVYTATDSNQQAHCRNQSLKRNSIQWWAGIPQDTTHLFCMVSDWKSRWEKIPSVLERLKTEAMSGVVENKQEALIFIHWSWVDRLWAPCDHINQWWMLIGFASWPDATHDLE